MYRPAHSQTGLSMIEVLVTLVIFTVGLLGLAALQLNALQGTSDSAQRSQAATLLQDYAERIRANPQASAATYATAVNCTALPAKMCADHFNPGTAAKVNAADCNATEIAAFDNWESSCSYAAVAAFNPNDGRFSSRDFLSASAATPVVAIANSNGVLTLTSIWLSKANNPQEKGKANRAEKVLSAQITELRR